MTAGMFEAKLRLLSLVDRSTVTVTFRGESNFDGRPGVEGSGDARERALEAMKGSPGGSYPLSVSDPMREWPALRHMLLELACGQHPLRIVEDTGPGELPEPPARDPDADY